MKSENVSKSDLNKPFIELLLNEMTELSLKGMSEDDEKEFGKRMQAVIFGKPITKKQIGRLHTKKTKFIRNLFHCFIELSESIETMKMIPAFINHYPHTSKYKHLRVTQSRYIKYHVENYFNEVYIYKERLVKLFSILNSECNAKQLPKEREYVNAIKATVMESIQGVCDTRNNHTHTKRFTDSKFDQMGVIDLLSQSDDQKLSKGLLLLSRIEVRQLKKKWIKQINLNNKRLETIQNDFLETLKELVFSKLYTKNAS